MHNRHPLEKSLHHEILHKDTAAANTLIDLISAKYEGPSLSSLDNMGRSFFNLALAVGLKDIADRLFKLQQNEPAIIWGVDSKHRTLMSIAAKKGYLDVVNKLIDLASKIEAGNTGYHHWQYPDDLGNLPLHYAAKNHHLDVVKALLRAMSIETNYINCINRINLETNTALHLACDTLLSNVDTEMVALLINHEADMTIRNEKGETPFEFIRQMHVSVQCELFAKLNKNKQKELLQNYRAYLIAEPTCDKAIYFSLSGMHSLSTLTAARLEFDEEMTIRNFYHRVDDEDVEIPSVIYDMVPLYAQRVYEAQGLAIDKKTVHTTTSTASIENYQILNDDLLTFKQLIHDVEAYMAELQARPKLSLSNQSLGVLTAVMIMAVYVGIEIWLGVMDHQYRTATNDAERKQYHHYFLVAPLLFGLGGILAFGPMAAIIGNFMFTYPPRIQNDEWRSIIDTLRSTVLEKLQLLEKVQNVDKADYLPVPAQIVRDLENSLTEFQESTKPLDDVIDMLQRLDAILIQIKTGLTLTNKPLSLFFKPAHELIAIDDHGISEAKVDELSDDVLSSDDEAVRLMSLGV